MEELLRSEIIRSIADHPCNLLPDSDSPYLDEPLVGFSSAADQLFIDYRQFIGLCQTKVPCESLVSPAHKV
jgi:hypothetical protein